MNRKIVIFGSGAVGGYFGAQLARQDENEVLFIARGTHLAAIQNTGLTIISRGQRSVEQIHAAETLHEYPGYPDYIFITVKAYHTADAIDAIRAHVGPETHVVTVQNGLESYDLLVDAFGSARVIRGFCGVAAELTAPGEITHTAFGRIVIGEEDGAISERCSDLASCFQYAGISNKISSDIRHDAWVKFAWNSIFNVITTITGVSVAQLYQSGQIDTLARRVFEEIRHVAYAEGVSLTDEDYAWVVDVSRDEPDFKPSTLQDRFRGKQLEYETFTGYVIRQAQANSIPVPVNNVFYDLLKCIDTNN